MSEHPQSEFIVARKLIIAKTSRHRQARQSGCRRDGFFRQHCLFSLFTTPLSRVSERAAGQDQSSHFHPGRIPDRLTLSTGTTCQPRSGDQRNQTTTRLRPPPAPKPTTLKCVHVCLQRWNSTPCSTNRPLSKYRAPRLSLSNNNFKSQKVMG